MLPCTLGGRISSKTGQEWAIIVLVPMVKVEPHRSGYFWPKLDNLSPQGQHALCPVLQTLPIGFYRNCMDRISKTGFFSLLTGFSSLLHCSKKNKCSESSRVIIQTRFHHCWQLLESCDSILLCPWAMKWLFPWYHCTKCSSYKLLQWQWILITQG